MSTENVEPLRITKASSTSPAKSPPMSRPLSEVNPMGIRRNSPSIAQNTSTQKQSFSRDSSPFETSPKNNASLSYWKNRESNSPSASANKNAPGVGGPQTQSRRVSVEALKKASRVNNNIFARKLEPEELAKSQGPLNRPLKGARPLSIQGNVFTGAGVAGLRSALGPARGHVKAESESAIAFQTRNDENRSPQSPGFKSISPSKDQISPVKSSLSRASRYATADNVAAAKEKASQDEKHVLRRPKSVTFDVAPPVINEYERATPVPSSVTSGSREGSYEFDPYDLDDDYPDPDAYEREDSFEESLEDTEKTPVVLPEDWRHMSPEAANTELAHTFDDPFGADQQVERQSSIALSRSGSVNRPLPPLPGATRSVEESSPERKLERSQSFQRVLPTPPRAPSISKQDIISMREASPMPLEERLRLLSVQRSAENLRATASRAESIPEEVNQDEEQEDESSDEAQNAQSHNQFRPPSRISRESILRGVQSEAADQFNADAYGEEASFDAYANLDPDVPIPSREGSGNFEESSITALVRDEQEEEQDSDIDEVNQDDQEQAVSHAMRVALELGLNPPHAVDYSRQSSVLHHVDIPHIAQLPELDLPELDNNGTRSTSGGSTDVQQSSRTLSSALTMTQDTQVSLPDFSSFVAGDDLDFGLHSFLSENPEDRDSQLDLTLRPSGVRETQFSKPAFLNPPPTLAAQASFESIAESVIHHSIDAEEEDDEVDEDLDVESERESSPEMPEVPASSATIKATGLNLKTRVSATPADIQAMAATRRLVSGEIRLPSFEDEEEPDMDIDEAEFEEEVEIDEDEDVISNEGTQAHSAPVGTQRHATRIPSMKPRLDLAIGDSEQEFSFGLDEEFARLMEDQKRGYIMRQNTKVVVASNRQVSEDIKQADLPPPPQATTATSSPTKALSPRKPSEPWKAEPWNGKVRRQSTRRSNIVPERRMSAVPPLPGHASNATTADVLAEDQYSYYNDDPDNTVERGRLFVKVVQVKDLELPLPRYGKCEFQMTLDNGVHCVTTSMLELGKTAPIGQEFELVVFDDLEFQLTLQTQLPKPPKSPQSTVFSSMTSSKPTSKVSKLTRLLQSPKKRREQEQRQREEEHAALQHRSEADAKRMGLHPGQWELQHDLVDTDGTFARAYISLKDHEKQAFGRLFTVDVPCFNEWTVEDKSIASSTRSKLGGMQRIPPYKIAKMELQMMYVPRPRGAQEEDMPRSMSAAMRQLREAESAHDIRFEGHLSQQGGDCPYWRRRFFRLDGSKLTAYHESTHQPRVTISLAKAIKLVDDRPSLTQDSSTGNEKNRRKSAFGSEEEGYMFVEEGFRIRFANGEVIDFYADSTADKEKWMAVLSQVVGRELAANKVNWTSAVLARERALAAKTGGKTNHLEEAKLPIRTASKTQTSPTRKPTTSSPSKQAVPTIQEEPADYKPSPPTAQTSSKRLSQQPPAKEKDSSTRGKRQGIKSMIF